MMDGTVTHIATRECLITQPHPALECAIVGPAAVSGGHRHGHAPAA